MSSISTPSGQSHDDGKFKATWSYIARMHKSVNKQRNPKQNIKQIFMYWCRYQLVRIICLDLISYNFILFMYDFLRIAYMYTMCFDQTPCPQCLPPTHLRSLIPYFPPNFIPLLKKEMGGLLFSEDKWRRIESGEEGE